MRYALALFAAFLLAVAPARAQQVAQHAIDIPPWFNETFLDFREDVREAAKANKRVMVYFGQDGCPYCKALMQTNFSQADIVEKTRRNFVAIALNIWGDRDVTWIDGRTESEKAFAARMKVQFTPTLLFLDEKGGIVARINGYYQPHRFEPVLDYVAGRMEGKLPLAEYLQKNVREQANARLADEPFFLKPPYDLRRRAGAKPVAVLFETPYCAACDEMHRDGFTRDEVRALVAKFDVVRLSLSDRAEVLTPSGQKTTGESFARSLNVSYTPTLVLFHDGREVHRIEAYVRPFHLASSLEYVVSGAYRKEPSFQRYVQARAERLREKGVAIDLMR